MAAKTGAINQPPPTPPRWAEYLLERLLAGADSQTVAGDLREQYAYDILPAVGGIRSAGWYLWQVLSLAPLAISTQSRSRAVLALVSAFTSAAAGWLVLMELLLRRPGYLPRAGMDSFLSLVPLITVFVLILHLGARAERWLRAGAIALLGIAAAALVRIVNAAHFEGFVLLISLVLALQGILMLTSLGRRASSSPGAGTGPTP